MPKKKTTKQTGRRSADPIASVYANTPGKNQKKKAKKRNPAGKIILVLIVVLLIALGVYKALDLVSNISLNGPVSILPGKTLAEGLKIADVNVGGLTYDEAVAKLEKKLTGTYAKKHMKVTVLDRTLEITPDESEVTMEAADIIEDVFTLGGAKDPDVQIDVTNYLRLNKEAVRNRVLEFAKFFPTTGKQTGWDILNEDVDGVQVEILELTIGTDYYDLDADALYNTVLDAYKAQNFRVDYPCQQLNVGTIDLDAIYEKNCIDVVDAVLDPETHEVTRSIEGYRFDLDAAREALENAEPGDVLTFPFEEIQPEMTTEELEAMLYRDTLGKYTAKASSQSGRDTNLKLSCQAINGTILYPGETFSYNEALGERTAEKGYKPAASYLNGETVQTYGGGICQTSSSLYYCVLLADLEVVSRSNHGYVSSYMPLGMDATVDWNGPDFQFRNNTDFPIRIEASASGGNVTVKLIGTDVKDYYVEMEYEVLSATKPKTIEEEVEAGSGHKDGDVKVTPYTGYKVQTYKCKYNKETKELISRDKEAYSSYSKRDKVVYKVIQVEPTTEATEATTQPTETTAPATPQPDETEPTRPPVEEATG